MPLAQFSEHSWFPAVLRVWGESKSQEGAGEGMADLYHELQPVLDAALQEKQQAAEHLEVAEQAAEDRVRVAVVGVPNAVSFSSPTPHCRLV